MNQRRLFFYTLALICILSTSLVTLAQHDLPELPDPAFSDVPLIVIGEEPQSPSAPAVLDPLTVTDENTAVDLTNQFRAAMGLACLNNDTQLRTAAYNHSKDMHDRDYFSHTAPAPAPNGTAPGDRITAAGYTWNTYGENISAGRTTPEEVILAWRASRGHYSGLINPNFQDIGLGYFDGSALNTSEYLHYWTMTLARKSGGSSAACPPNPPAIPHQPTNLGSSNLNQANPTFTWTHDTSTTTARTPATHYDIEIVKLIDPGTLEITDGAPSHGYPQEFTAASLCSGSTCTLNYPRTLENGNYKLYVRAYSATGGYTWSSAAHDFTVNISGSPTPTATTEPTPTTGGLDVTSPSGTVINSHGRPVYQWQDDSTASYYEIVVATKDLTMVNFYGRISRATYCNGDTCTVNLTEVPANQTYVPGFAWLVNGDYVLYINPDPPTIPAWKGPYEFRIQEAAPAAVTEGATTYPNALRPQIHWTLEGDAQNAAFFQLYVAPMNAVQNSIFGYLATKWFTRPELCGSWDGVDCSFTVPQNLVNDTVYGAYINSWSPGGLSTGGEFAGTPADGWTEILFDVGDPSKNPPPSSDEQTVVNSVNAHRQQLGLSCLVINPLLTQASQNHSSDMAARNYFDHFAPAPAPTGISPWDRTGFVGYMGDNIRENIAAGIGLDAAGAYDTWLTSQGHYENMFADDINEIGVAKATAQDGEVYWTMVLGYRPGVTCG